MGSTHSVWWDTSVLRQGHTCPQSANSTTGSVGPEATCRELREERHGRQEGNTAQPGLRMAGIRGQILGLWAQRCDGPWGPLGHSPGLKPLGSTGSQLTTRAGEGAQRANTSR